jgi:beta-fructofuranosidase
MPWFPRNKYLWDFWFARKGEELHLFFLQASHLECGFNPDRRHNLSSIGAAVMTPWGWRESDSAVLSKANGNAWDDLSIWTGCVVTPPEADLHYLFYTARRATDEPVWTPSEWQRRQQIGLAISHDLLTWERTAQSKKTPVIPNPGKMAGLDGVAWRDPYVIRGEDGAWHAFICARLNPLDANNKDFGLDAGGVVAWLKSDDLEEWDVAGTRRLVTSDEFYQMEVPQVFWRRFERGKRFYLIFCAQERDCSRARRARVGAAQCRTGTYYLHSELLPHDYHDIPLLAGSAKLLAADWYAGRLLDPETARQPLFFGFQWADEAGHFVGGISDPMPARFKEDGAIELI